MSINWSFIIIIIISLIHINIIKYELKYKKIPNKLLLVLFVMNLIFIIINGNNIFIIPTLIKFITLIVLIIIVYLFKIWHPGYIKYIFVSSLFFLGNNEISFLSNIFFIIGVYIFIYFCYFYLKILINPNKIKTYLLPLKQKTKGNFHNWVIKNQKNITIKIIISILGFFSIFILIRFIRYYLNGELSFLYKTIEINNININTFLIVILLIFLLTTTIYKLYKKYLVNNYKFLIIIIILTVFFISYEFIYDYEFVSNYLHKILTFLIFIYIILWIIIHMGIYLFFDSDSKIIDYKNLKAGNIIDKTILNTYLVGQKNLKNINIPGVLKTIKNPINKEDCEKIKKIIQKNSDFHEKLGNSLPPNIIRIYNSFTFSPFIFGSFLITLFVGKNILINFIIISFNKIMGL